MATYTHVPQHRNTIAVSYTCAATPQHHCSELYMCCNTATPLQYMCAATYRNTTAVSYTCATTPLQYTCAATPQHHCSELYMCCNTAKPLQCMSHIATCAATPQHHCSELYMCRNTIAVSYTCAPTPLQAVS